MRGDRDQGRRPGQYRDRRAKTIRQPCAASTDNQGLARDNKAGAGGKVQHKAWLACLERCCNGADRERMWRKIGTWCRDWEFSDTTGRDNTDQRSAKGAQ